ncbi:uncharacterized protein LOC111683957 [Lucilia cuprina]|uniref:uncharacterized protein LOC111683957 n=1 Tax=Lucilia cuprina TaxID=7375 RepID=UPI001F0573D4|nr:uncharacterized protein LOC111683957 [Lucilia cuprina]
MWLNLLIFLTINVILIKSNDDLKVCLENLGCLEGTEMPGLSGDNFEAFLGVPFAKPPIGELRFRNPVPVEPWQGVLSAKAAKPDCKQRNYLIPHWPIVGDEDCLYMNIYRPKGVLPENPLPVIFYIYGGGFFSGSSNPAVMGSEYFMDTREVLVVVITYRLGPFGFLSTGSSEMPGNFGLKDQLLALKWVNDHIKSFGGDPNQVTLLGHSAGGSAVHFLMINPKMFCIKLLFGYLLANVVLVQCQDPTVCLPDAGCYIGLFMKGYQKKEFKAFLGVPYAFPPKRFEPPIRYTSNKTHKVVKPQFDCVQKNYLIPNHPISGSEDCLYLNVYKPIIHRLALPVMVYIFGGGFFAGSAAPIFTGPEYLMDRGDVIVVTINYRLGAFGFLSTNDGNIPGNLGLKDQVMALSWVRDNIPYFGGDRNRVTLFGQSAGAVSAHLHMLSKLSRNLFNAVITISGSANVPWAIDDDPETTFRLTCRYSNLTGWDTKTTERLTRELKVVPIYTLLDAGDKLKFFDVDIMVNYRPTIEPRGPEAFLDNNPAFIIKSGLYNAVPMLVGTVPNEGGVRVVAIMENEELKQAFNKDFYRIMVTFLEFPKRFNVTQIQKKMDLILNEYFGGVQELNNKTRQGFMDLVTDRGFHHPMYNAMKWFVKKNNVYITQLFLYVFDYRGRYTFANIFAGHPTPEYGVIHCDDLIYLFRAFRIFPDFPKNSSDAAAIKGYVDYLTYFAHWRQPPIEPTFKRCNDKNFFSGEGKICDYQEFVNGEEDEWVVRVNNQFNTTRMHLWDRILEEDYELLVSNSLPVMIYMHAGGLFSGSASPFVTGPEYMMDRGNVTLITIAYRLGAFGFLTTNDDCITGNIGLKDQRVALTCVFLNIEHFGGDRERITLFGHDAGAVSAHMPMLSKQYTNLFYAIIALSGTANVPWAIDEKPMKTARQTARYCNISDWDTISTYDLKNALQNVSADTLFEAGEQLKYGIVDDTAKYRPVIEKPSYNAFLDDYPVNILQSGNYTPVPIMFGYVSKEGGYRVAPIMETEELGKDFNKQFFLLTDALPVMVYIHGGGFFSGTANPNVTGPQYIMNQLNVILVTLAFGHDAGAVSAHMHMLSKRSNNLFYAIIALSGTANVPWAIDEEPLRTARLTENILVTHRFFLHPLYNAIKMHVETIDTDPIYMYRFNFLGSATFADIYTDHPTDRQYGVVFFNDLIYLFKSSIFPDFEDIPSELEAIEVFEENFVYFVHNSLALQCLSDDPKVCATGVGCYIGTVMEYKSKKFEAFLGIPYAFPPKRFEVAVPYESKETHQAKTAQEDCIQKNYLLPTKPITGSEDCLYLNIYRPQNISEALPVMVYIFGGGFFAGTASPIITGPEFILQHNNIILVTLGYRLGPFGFLTTNDDSLPGNLGLKDQNMALEWVFEYIQFFGGDRSRTTLFGQSAGAVSAHLHMLSEKSKGLFYAIIALSGTANVPWAIDENPKETARLTAKYCNIKNWNKASTKRLKIALQKVSAEKLLNAGDHLKYWDVDNMVNYRPIVERPSPNAFLTEHPVNILHDGKYDPVPIMFGRVPNEGGVRVVAIMESDKLRNEFNKRFFELMEKFLELPKIFNTTEKTKLIIKEYFHGTNELNNDTQQNFMDLVTHRGFYHPLYNAIKMHVEKIDTNLYPVYMYKFNYQGTYTYADMYAGHPTGSKYGVVHCNDLIYLFRTSILFPDFKPDSNDAVVVEKFVDDFVYFAHFRKPKIYQKIKPCNKENFYPQEGKICDYHEFVNSENGSLIIKINDEFDTKHMQFWDDILK